MPDDLVTTGYQAILEINNVIDCRRVSNCPFRDTRQTGVEPAEHLHLVPSETLMPDTTEADPICLYRISQIFHAQRIPNMDANSEDLMLASDPRIPPRASGYCCGPFPMDLYPVRIPDPHFYAETVIRRWIYDKPNGPDDTRHLYWTHILAYLCLYVEGQQPILFDHNKLNPPFRWFWKKCCVGPTPELKVNDGIRQLEEKLAPLTE